MAMNFETVALDDKNSALVIVDQTRLPGEVVTLRLTGQQEIQDAIRTLKVRGAPAIGVAAAIGLYLAAKSICAADFDAFYHEFRAAKDALAATRPTASRAIHSTGPRRDGLSVTEPSPCLRQGRTRGLGCGEGVPVWRSPPTRG